MAEVRPGRFSAEIDGDVVVPLTRPRVNAPRLPPKVRGDLGGRRRGWKAMLDERVARPEKGPLGYRIGFPAIGQYWRSLEHLAAFARDPGDGHRPTRLEYEAVHDDVPVAGLAAAGPATRGVARP